MIKIKQGEVKNMVNGRDEVSKVSRRSHVDKTIRTQKAQQAQFVARMVARQVGSKALFVQVAENNIFVPRYIKKDFRPLKEQALRQPKQAKLPPTVKSAEEQEIDAAAEEIAEDYYQRNPELQKKTLLALYQSIKPEDSHAQILEKIAKVYKDKFLIDSAISYLIDVARTKEEVKQKLIQLKENFNAEFGSEIRAGYNILEKVHEFSEKGLGTKTALRDLYRDITNNPRAPYALFKELTEKFKFTDMKNIIDFILHALGSDMKAEGPSIGRAKLQRFCEETRTMQAILGLFRFFYNRMPMVKRQFDNAGLAIPNRVNFDALARLFMKILQERYPTSKKISQVAFTLGIAEEILAQIIIFSQYRDAIRNISPKFFRSHRHQRELFLALIETLSDLEDEEEEEDEEDKPISHPPKDRIE